VLVVAEVLIEEGTVLAVKMVLSSSALVATWCSWGLFSWLGWAGGHRHLFGRFWFSPICQFAVTTTKDIISRDIEEY